MFHVSTGWSRVGRGAAAAVCGLLAAAAALGAAELAAAFVRPEAAPLTSVGGAVIDATPQPVKDWAIRTFGTDDKLVLRIGILTLLALFALAVGLLARRHRRTGAAAVLAFGVLGAAAALGRPGGGPGDAVPSLVGAVVGAGVLYGLAGILTPAPAAVPEAPPPTGPHETPPTGPHDTPPTAPHDTPPLPAATRRRFVTAATAVAAASAGAGLLGREVADRRNAPAVASRREIRLPAPDSPAPPVPRGAQLGIKGIGPFFTPNRDFYRVDTALVVPRVNADRWRLRIHGDGVREPLTLDYAELLRRELIERDITLNCVSNEVGGPYIGNARWLGVRLADVLREAGVRPPSQGGPADQLVARSVEGMTIGTPVETVMDGRDALLALGMNGEPLPFDHGFPVRMLVPGLYGYVSACKWLTDLELTTFSAYDAYWVQRGWAERAPVKTQSRIDTPKPFARPAAGRVAVAGVAWAQHRGVERVEVRVDDGPWRAARLAAEDTSDTWRQWVWEWDATPGRHTLQVRATDGTGDTQTADRVSPFPDGATGRHSVVVTVT
ncbi:molybdopterin-dependent oxidoreductase [Streptomyces sp. NPDC051940]|uniref:molybdopterin-dependent oxidoreductase n=1 Tax=Streptomyces sp. NPDC051940 TaxID=3155675 RepID=UPI003443F0E3